MPIPNDFLGSLSQRSLNQTLDDGGKIGDVRPRLAARFEPPAGATPIVHTQPDALIEVEELLDAPVPSRRRTSSNDERRPEHQPHPSGDAPRREQTVDRSARPDPTANSSPVIVPQSTIVIRDVAQPPREDVRPVVPVTPDGLAQPQSIIETIRHERVVERIVERERTYTLTQAQDHAKQPQASRAGDQTSQSPANATALIKPKVEPMPASIARRRSEASHPISSTGGARGSETPAPIIQVTIGRIEVRAAPPTPPVKRGAPPVSTLSLEAYLRSRSGDRG